MDDSKLADPVSMSPLGAYAELGDIDRGVEWLRRAFEERAIIRRARDSC